MSEIAAKRIIEQSNDNTFNIIIDYRRYNDDKYSIVVKNGGIVTRNSISKPKYKLITNIDVHKQDKPHVVEFDNLKQAFEYIDKHENLEKLDDNSQAYFKPIIKSVLGNAVFMTNHTNTALLNHIRDAARATIKEQNALIYVEHSLNNIRKLTNDIRNQVNYNWGIQQFDKLYAKCRKVANVDKLIEAMDLYNNFICR